MLLTISSALLVGQLLEGEGHHMDRLAAYAGYILGYGSIALVLFSIAFVLAKTLKRAWPYKLALALTVIAYAAVILGLNYVNQSA